jgi:hypothetical protein
LQRVFGEIDFYLVERPVNFEGTISALEKGTFIGTDYDFMFNPKLRQTIFDSCLETDSLLIRFKTFERLEPSI